MEAMEAEAKEAALKPFRFHIPGYGVPGPKDTGGTDHLLSEEEYLAEKSAYEAKKRREA